MAVNVTCMPQREEARAPTVYHEVTAEDTGLWHIVLDQLYGFDFEVWVGVALAVFAITVTTLGILFLEFSRFQRIFGVLALVFLCTQAFSLVEMVRNCILVKSADEEMDKDHFYQRFLLRGAAFTRGHGVYRFTVVAGFLVAVGCSIFGVVVLPSIPPAEWTTQPPTLAPLQPVGVYSMVAPTTTTTTTTTTTSDVRGALKHLHPGKVMVLSGWIFGLSSTVLVASDLRDLRSKEIWMDSIYRPTDAQPFAAVEAHHVMKVLLLNAALVAVDAQHANLLTFAIFVILSVTATWYAFTVFSALRSGFGFLFAGIGITLMMVFALAQAFEDPPEYDPDNDDPTQPPDLETEFLRHIAVDATRGQHHRTLRTLLAGSGLVLGLLLMWYGIFRENEPFEVKGAMLFAVLGLLGSFFGAVKAFFRGKHAGKLRDAIEVFEWRR